MKYYVVDAFASQLFKGNPAGICLLDEWIDDATMQNIAFENNLAETAFLVQNNNSFELRWFTPECEIDLCGHGNREHRRGRNSSDYYTESINLLTSERSAYNAGDHYRR